MKRKSSGGLALKTGEYEKKEGGFVYRWTDVRGNRHSVDAKTLNELRKKERLVKIMTNLCPKKMVKYSQVCEL